MDTYTAAEHTQILDQRTTQHLIEQYRQHPTPAVQTELHRRGVQLWHYGLAPVA